MHSTKNPEREAAPIFILSCERSGSTLLRYIVDTHPEICCPPEVYLGNLCSGLHIAVNHTLGQLDGAPAHQQQKAWVSAEVRRMLEDLMDRYAQGRGKRLWCEKSPHNTLYLDDLDTVFTDARYICLYRYPLDVVQSCLKFNPLGFMQDIAPYIRQYPDNTVRALLNYWCDYTRKITAFEQRNQERCFRMTLEGLVTEPNRLLKDMFAFLGCAWSEDLLAKVFTTSHGYGDGDLNVHFSKSIDPSVIGKGIAIPFTSVPADMIDSVDELNRLVGFPSLRAYYGLEEAGHDAASERRIEALLAQAIQGNLQEEETVLKGKNAGFYVQGRQGGSWVIHVKSDGAFELGRPSGEVGLDCSIALSSSVFFDLLDGKRRVVDACENGEVGADGDLALAIEFGKLIFT